VCLVGAIHFDARVLDLVLANVDDVLHVVDDVLRLGGDVADRVEDGGNVGEGEPTILTTTWTTLRMPEVTLRAVPRLRTTSLCFRSAISCAVASTGVW